MKYFLSTNALQYWYDQYFLLNLLKVLSVLCLSFIVNFYAVRYATLHTGQATSDLIFEHILYIDSRIVGHYSVFFSTLVLSVYLCFHPQRILFFLKTTSVLVLVRDFFIDLTHVGVPVVAHPTVSFVSQGGDLFFSGHTALPFLASLVFWNDRPARYTFLFFSFSLGAESLIGRLNYSIDVFAAPFITYGIYILCQKVFKKDYAMIHTNADRLADK